MARHAHEFQCDGNGTFGTPSNNERSNATWYTKDRNRKSLEQVGQAA